MSLIIILEVSIIGLGLNTYTNNLLFFQQDAAITKTIYRIIQWKL